MGCTSSSESGGDGSAASKLKKIKFEKTEVADVDTYFGGLDKILKTINEIMDPLTEGKAKLFEATGFKGVKEACKSYYDIIFIRAQACRYSHDHLYLLNC